MVAAVSTMPTVVGCQQGAVSTRLGKLVGLLACNSNKSSSSSSRRWLEPNSDASCLKNKTDPISSYILLAKGSVWLRAESKCCRKVRAKREYLKALLRLVYWTAQLLNKTLTILCFNLNTSQVHACC